MAADTAHENWKSFFEAKAERSASDFEYDRGVSPRPTEIECLATSELLGFIDPQPWEVVFDAGCGTGANIALLHSRVRGIIGMDYSDGAIARCERRLLAAGIKNVRLLRGDVTAPPLSNNSADKILCMSVLQYLTDAQVRRSFAEFARILRERGTLILHVKNLSSFYLSTLWAMKKTKLLLGMKTNVPHLRPYRWYVAELQAFGFEVVAYNSFNLLTVELMPNTLKRYFEKLELRYYDRFPFRLGFMRRHGSELKMRAKLTKKLADPARHLA